MSRIYLGRGCRGSLVGEAQQNLKQEGYYTGNVDNTYGGVTQTAVTRFQEEQDLPETGAIDGDTWQDLMRREPPSLFHRCVQVTAAFEGHGFGAVAGAYDDGWLTWGIIGFTLGSGTLNGVLLEVWENNPEIIRSSFGSKTDELIEILTASRRSQKAWAESISEPPKNYRVIEPWRSSFMALGQSPAVQAVQLRHAETRYFVPAMRLRADLALEEELGAALCFDIQVQNGGLRSQAKRRIETFREEHSEADEQTFRTVIADAVADAALPRFREDVRARKRTMAAGEGTVHQAAYTLANWGLGAFPWDD